MSIRTPTPGDYLPTEREAESGEALSLIDRHSAFEGTFRTERDLRIEGDVKGSVVCQGLVFVAQGATVDATVEAENVTVAGDLNGEITCRGRLQILPSGRMRGKVSTGSLVINEGAFYEGELQMADPDDRARHARGGVQALAGPVPISAATEGRALQGGGTTFVRRLGSSEAPWEGRAAEGAEHADDDAGGNDS